MTIYKTWDDVFKEPIWTVRDFVEEIEWIQGKVNIIQSGHAEYQVRQIFLAIQNKLICLFNHVIIIRLLYQNFQLVIETIAGTTKRGWTAIDDFVFVAGDECALKPSYARPAELGHDCSFDNGLCGQWYEIYLPGESFWNLTSGQDLEAMGIDGPIVDAHDTKNGNSKF